MNQPIAMDCYTRMDVHIFRDCSHNHRTSVTSEFSFTYAILSVILTAAVAEWVRAWDTLKLRCVEGREFDPRPGQYSTMSFSSDQETGTVFPYLNMPFLPNSEFI